MATTLNTVARSNLRASKGKYVLTGTSEVALAGYHADEILDLGAGPKRDLGWSTCYRREAGSAGKDFDQTEGKEIVGAHAGGAAGSPFLAQTYCTLYRTPAIGLYGDVDAGHVPARHGRARREVLLVAVQPLYSRRWINGCWF